MIFAHGAVKAANWLIGKQAANIPWRRCWGCNWPALAPQPTLKLFVGSGDSGKLSIINLSLVVIILAAVAVSIIGTEPTILHDPSQPDNRLGDRLRGDLPGGISARLWSIAEAPGPGSALAKRLRFLISPLAIIDLIVIVTSLMPFFFVDSAILRLLRLIRIYRARQVHPFFACGRGNLQGRVGPALRAHRHYRPAWVLLAAWLGGAVLAEGMSSPRSSAASARAVVGRSSR